MMTFEQLDLIEPIRKALAQEGYINPTPIQSEAIPIVLQGKDLLGCAQTGTGKTAAFSIPILQRLYLRKQNAKLKGIKALVLTPTRELAVQIDESFAAYGRFTGLRHTVVYGGVSQRAQARTLAEGVDILIATPGRLLDLMGQGFVRLNSVEYLVLDEADRMLDMGFIVDIKRILAELPKRRQSLFFSATMPPEIGRLADRILCDPVKVEVTPPASTVDTIDQSIYFVLRTEKLDLLKKLLEDPALESVLIFTRTKHGADRVARALAKAGIPSAAIHSNKSQTARQQALTALKNHTMRVLIATDIAARGIDVDQLSHVINFDLPNEPETYVHRIGRTGRAGRNGIAISLCDAVEMPQLAAIEKLIGKKIPVAGGEPFPAAEVKAAIAAKKENQITRKKEWLAKKKEKELRRLLH